jgi:hypothetical protein
MTTDRLDAHGVDYDIHGIVGIRLAGARAADVAAVDIQLGSWRRPLARPPEIVLRYVDALPSRSAPRIAVGRAWFTTDGRSVLRSGRRGAEASLALDEIGGTCEILCEHGIGDVPLLMPIVNLAALARGFVAVHASAVVYDGAGVLMPAWAQGGKTTGMLAFLAHGAEYVGDEWVLVSRDGRWIHGLPQGVVVHDWQLQQLPSLRRQVSATRRMASAAARVLDEGAVGRLAARVVPNGSSSRVLRRVAGAARRRLDVSIDPFALAAGARPTLAARLDTVVFMVRHDGNDVRLRRTGAWEMASCIAASTEHELSSLDAVYLAFQCAFPGRSNPWLDGAHDLRIDLLTRALEPKALFALCHPPRGSLQELFAAMAPVCRREDPVRNTCAILEAPV